MGRTVTASLCLMMFLEFAVRGMWHPFVANDLVAGRADGVLGFAEGRSGWVLGFAGAAGAVTAPVIAGRVADRWLNAERALALLHCITALLLFLNAPSESFAIFTGGAVRAAV
jgi:MFS family permease